MQHGPQTELLRQTVVALAESCPRLASKCYWARTSAIALEELHHRDSFDLDFHTREPLVDTRPFLAELERAFPGRVELAAAPDAFGSGFTGLLRVSNTEKLPLQVFAGFESVPDSDLVPSTTAPKLLRVTLGRYLADKVQCVVERIEARDLVDIAAVIRAQPRMKRALRIAVRSQDALVLVERLSGWTDASVADDLAGYPGVDPADALQMRDELLQIARTESSK